MENFMKLRLLTLLLFVIALSCGQKGPYKLLEVGPQTLRSDSFEKRFVRSSRFNQNTSFSSDQIKAILEEKEVETMLFVAEGYDLKLHLNKEIREKLEFEKKKNLTHSKGPLFKKLVPDSFSVSDEEIKAYHDDLNKEIKVAHILVEEQSLADSLYELIKNGESFASLAANFSTDFTTASDSGIMQNYFTRGQFGMDFECVAFDLERGNVSKPVETIYGYHIIKLLDSRERQTAPMSEMEAGLRKRLLQTKEQEYIQKILHRLHQKYDLTIDAQYFDDISRAYREEIGKKEVLLNQIDTDILSEPFIQWQGGGWTVQEFVHQYNSMPVYTKSALKGRVKFKDFCIRMATPELMYREALRLGLDKQESYRQEIRSIRDHLVGEKCREELIYSRIVLTDKEMESYYNENFEKFEFFTKDRAMELIKNQLVSDKARALESSVISDLKAKYKIRFYDKNISRMAKHLTNLKTG
jgi:peptidyl-prolyl cis-trans isomerase C